MRKKFTTEEFIQKARKVHGDKYDYSKTIYIKALDKTIIICPIHGKFLQAPHSHLRGDGCPKCGGTGKFTTEDFIQKAREVHGNKYDYSLIDYINSKLNIIIICPEHGEFKQTPNSHLDGQGCPKCYGLYKTTKDFIIEAKKIHGDKYDYSLVDYINATTKIIIICPKHGEFKQQPYSHLSKIGCPKCGGTGKFTTEEFIQKNKAIHGEKYDYSKTNYVSNNIKVIIICPEHGEFEQTPHQHISGEGCPKCSGFGFTYLPVNEAMKIIGKLGFKTREEYFKWWDDNKEYCQKIGLPKTGAEYYKNY